MKSSVTKLIVIVGVVMAAFIAVTVAPATNDNKITICHVAGLASDPANYITLTIAPPAVFGPGGHFNEDGTTQAGHEQDTMGECNPPPPPPPHDECPDIEGNQPEGTDCTPEPPPCTENCTPPPPPPCTVNCTPPPPVERCPPGMVPTNGKDGEPGNDECEFPQPPPTTTVVAPPVTGGSSPTPASTTTVTPPAPVTPPATKPVVKPKPKVVAVTKKKQSTKIVSVKKKQHGVVIIKTADGKTHVGQMGAG